MNKLIVALIFVFLLIGAAPAIMAEKACVVPLEPGDEAAIKANPETFSDLGSYRVITVRGKLARVWWEWKYNKHNIIIDNQKHVIIILILEDDI